MQNRILNPGKVFLLVTVSLLFSACGGSGGGGGEDGDSSNSAPLALAGSDQDVARNGDVTLDGSGSSDPENDSLTYTWTQTSGPDVTGGGGTLTGISPSFTAPSDVSTVMFDLSVNDGSLESAIADRVQINVMEKPSVAVYVDGEAGDDTTGDGSRQSPYRTITHALTQVPQGGDIYVKTMDGQAYVENGAANSAAPDIVSLTIPDGTSLYGGFDENWVRDVDNNKTALNTRARGIHFGSVNNDAWFSGFMLNAFNPPAWTTPVSTAISADNEIGPKYTGTLHIQDNDIVAGDANGISASSYGIRLKGFDAVRILRNNIAAGDGGNGVAGANGPSGNYGGTGGSPSGQSGGGGGDHFCAWGSTATLTCENLASVSTPGGGRASASIEGGAGGRGGNKLGNNGIRGGTGFVDGDPFTDPSGASGGAGGDFSHQDGYNGSGGIGGGFQTPYTYNGRGGNGGDGHGSIGSGEFVNSSARDGIRGGHGGGGGGGGGSEGNLTTDGAGGGGGGGGGVGGQGGKAGGSGGASIGILVADISDLLIDGNSVISTNGGSGAAGGNGGQGGNGGNGGSGATSSGDTGGKGGGGGRGGQGGQGGAGGGGPSYSILVGSNMAPDIVNNALIAGTGGAPGADGNGNNGGARGGQWGDAGSSSGSGASTYNNAVRGSDGAQAQGGWSYTIYDIDTGDGLVPFVNNNSSTPGTAGVRGQAGAQNF